MQKLGRTLARFGAARALLAGAAILAGAAGPVGGKGASDANDDIALAIPRITVPGATPRVALPQPLAPSEAERIRRIFALQERRDIPAAIAECERLTDRTLLPHILAERYLGGQGPGQIRRPVRLACLLSRPAGRAGDLSAAGRSIAEGRGRARSAGADPIVAGRSARRRRGTLPTAVRPQARAGPHGTRPPPAAARTARSS